MHMISPLDSFIRPFSAPERLSRSTSDLQHLLEPSKIASRSGVTIANSGNDAMDSYNTLTPMKQIQQQECAACSKSIPIPSKGLQRTPSELQLLQDEATADYQDYCMYVRIVNGIRSRGGGGGENNPLSLANAVANIHSVQNIIRTRYLPAPEDVSFSQQPDDDEFLRQEWQVLCPICGGTVVDLEDQEGIFILDM